VKVTLRKVPQKIHCHPVVFGEIPFPPKESRKQPDGEVEMVVVRAHREVGDDFRMVNPTWSKTKQRIGRPV